PIYQIPTKIGYSDGGAFKNLPVTLSKADETFEFTLPAKPKAVLLDPDHDFLREIPTYNWSAEELPVILQHSTNAPYRQQAMTMLLRDPSDANVRLVTDLVAKDRSLEQPVFRQLTPLINLNKPELRGFWMGQLSHPNMDR